MIMVYAAGKGYVNVQDGRILRVVVNPGVP
jgi:hypothetical protein